MSFLFRKANDKDIKKIKILADNFNLDSDNLEPQKTHIVEKNGDLAGFGRYKNYRNIHEISTIGVLKNYRNMNIGKIITGNLIESAGSGTEIWLTTIIPDFFSKFGFKVKKNAPFELVLKTKKICKKYNKPFNKNIFMKLEYF